MPSFSGLALAIAALATLAWLGLVRWRTGRHRAVIWKSVVLPAGGVALCWLLLMTLWLPLLDYARSSGPWSAHGRRPRNACVAAPQVPRALLAALESTGGPTSMRPAAALTPCGYLLARQSARCRRRPARLGADCPRRAARPTG
ncbi:hypothetical protein [Piscinibacter sp.]|uniref:hypothetical protein n=1 Tax=Piscinibacter sp. TaxID=1903157 RepID=UPI0025D7C7EC|nr:hypothetical protein [Piscinibacter sp.]